MVRLTARRQAAARGRDYTGGGPTAPGWRLLERFPLRWRATGAQGAGPGKSSLQSRRVRTLAIASRPLAAPARDARTRCSFRSDFGLTLPGPLHSPAAARHRTGKRAGSNQGILNAETTHVTLPMRPQEGSNEVRPTRRPA